MFTDFYTQKKYKGVGVTDINGHKICIDDVIPIYRTPKGTIVSRFDPAIFHDAIYPNRILYAGISSTKELVVESAGRKYQFGLISADNNDAVLVINENGQEGRTATLEQALSIPNMVEHIPYGAVVHKSMLGKLPTRKYERFPHPKFDKTSYKECMKYGAISPTYLISEGKQYTFGVEAETYTGFIPPYVHRDLNIDCQYDGSVTDSSGHKDTGGEYTTGVLKGDMGFAHLYKICYEISKRCKVNNTCSIHVHLGNIIFNKEFVVLSYKLCESIEKELFNMMPESRRHREHCQPIKHLNINLKQRGIPYDILIDKYYDSIVKIISLGKAAGPNINKKFNHPAGRYCNYDRSTPRYWWYNLVPTLFNLKGEGNHTLEIRNHSATMDFIKIRNWILICMGIVSFVENHKREIIRSPSISIKTIMKTVYPNKGTYLSDYITNRTELFDRSIHGNQSEIENMEYDDNHNKNVIINPGIKKIVTL